MKEIKSITDKKFYELLHSPDYKSRIKSIIEKYTDAYDDWTDFGVAVELTNRDIQIEQLQARIKELESDKHVNEIKAQGIEYAVEYGAFDCTVYDDPVAVLEKVERYAKILRGNNE